MNKKILGVLVALLAVALLTVPVMGKPASKIEPVTLNAENIVQVPDEGYPRLVGHGTISHSKGISYNTVPNSVTLTIGVITLHGDWTGEWIGKGKISENPAETEVLIMGKIVLTFPGGTFEGTVHRTIIGFPPDPPIVIPYFIDRIVLRGTGDFQAWTLKLSYEGSPPPVATGYAIIPK